jgi:hypothetical protein
MGTSRRPAVERLFEHRQSSRGRKRREIDAPTRMVAAFWCRLQNAGKQSVGVALDSRRFVRIR